MSTPIMRAVDELGVRGPLDDISGVDVVRAVLAAALDVDEMAREFDRHVVTDGLCSCGLDDVLTSWSAVHQHIAADLRDHILGGAS
jgi:hypothetical protein